jgi:acyl-CoA synthetase (AMP-forming)/AMP-acid ligase II
MVEKPSSIGRDDMVRSLDEGTSDVSATWNGLFLAQWSGSVRPAIVAPEGTWSGEELVARAHAVGAWLGGVGALPGQGVPALVEGSPAAVVLAVAGALHGRPLAPLAVRATQAELVTAIQGLGSDGLVTTPEHEQLAEEVATAAGVGVHVVDLARLEPSDDLPAGAPAADAGVSIVHTSGTTGRPKPVWARQAAMAARVRVYDDVMPVGPGDRFCTASPFHHTAGINMVLTVLARGATVLPMARFDLDGWRRMGALSVTHALLVPTMIDQLLAAGRLGEAHPEVLQYGAAPIDPRTLGEALAVLPGTELLQVYGQTEMSPITQLTHADHLRALAGRPELLASVGRAAPGTTIRLADEGADGVGELVVAGPHQFAGAPGEERRTGDLGRIDDEGYVTLMGRIDDRIVWAGENIYPAEVEAAIGSHPGVAEVAVVGVPDRRYGEVVRAVVVPADPASPPSEDELRTHAAAHLARFKVPTQLAFADSLPRNAAGKVVRRALLGAPDP